MQIGNRTCKWNAFTGRGLIDGTTLQLEFDATYLSYACQK